MIKYVVGFAFNLKQDKILLITKLKPKWQKGCLNGIGGKIELSETSKQAMTRETKEETGLNLPWIERGVMRGVNNDGTSFFCHVFYAFSNNIYNYKILEEERLGVYPIKHIKKLKHIENVPFLIEFGLSPDKRPFLILEYGTGL